MRAAVLHTPGEPPRLAEHPDPTAGEGRTLVRVTAAPLVPLDLLCASGTSYFGRPAVPYVPGVQGVGVVETSSALRGRDPGVVRDDGRHGARRRQPRRALRGAGRRPGAARHRRARPARRRTRAVRRRGVDVPDLARPAGAGGAGARARRRRSRRTGRDRRRAGARCEPGGRRRPLGGGPRSRPGRRRRRGRPVHGRRRRPGRRLARGRAAARRTSCWTRSSARLRRRRPGCSRTAGAW